MRTSDEIITDLSLIRDDVSVCEEIITDLRCARDDVSFYQGILNILETRQFLLSQELTQVLKEKQQKSNADPQK